jgi:hypothetical protein
MTHILLATKNADKIKLLSNLIKNVIPDLPFKFYSLADFNISTDVEESGSIEDRAKQKAVFYTKEYLSKDTEIKIDYILGVDDGIIIEKLGEKTPETKKIVDLIINENLLQLNDRVMIVRGYCFFKLENQKAYSVTTEIPFKYIGNEKQITRIEGKYPLSYLLSHIDKNKAIVDTSEEEIKEYDLKYSTKIKQVFGL